jgi:hypothetical protein
MEERKLQLQLFFEAKFEIVIANDSIGSHDRV